MFLAGALVLPGLATVVAASQPIWAALLAAAAIRERIGLRGWGGMTLALAGIATLAMSGSGSAAAAHAVHGIALVLLGAVGVAIGNVVMKLLAGAIPVLTAMGWQLLLGALPLTAASLAAEPLGGSDWSLDAVGIVILLSLGGTALPSALWFWLLERCELSQANAFSFLTPVIALAIGAAAFGERLGWAGFAGVGVTLVGIARVGRRGPPAPDPRAGSSDRKL